MNSETISKVIEASEAAENIGQGLQDLDFQLYESAEKNFRIAKEINDRSPVSTIELLLTFWLAELELLKDKDICKYAAKIRPCANSFLYKPVQEKLIALRSHFKTYECFERNFHLLAIPLSISFEYEGYINEANQIIFEARQFAAKFPDTELEKLCAERLGELALAFLELSTAFSPNNRIWKT